MEAVRDLWPGEAVNAMHEASLARLKQQLVGFLGEGRSRPGVGRPALDRAIGVGPERPGGLREHRRVAGAEMGGFAERADWGDPFVLEPEA